MASAHTQATGARGFWRTKESLLCGMRLAAKNNTSSGLLKPRLSELREHLGGVRGYYELSFSYKKDFRGKLESALPRYGPDSLLPLELTNQDNTARVC